ncbi:MAG: adenylate/guanylate cyclase domain-containing protein [Verrucomicrobiota bacterium]|nr:adenylate/guanylate cyclase domain-containing protein [Verrucomicrobiota bacterium]
MFNKLKKFFKGSRSFFFGIMILFVFIFLYIVNVFYGDPISEKVAFLNHGIIDNMFRQRGITMVDSQIVIVDIDEKSLQKFGQWPWPRTVMAKLLRKLDEYEVKVTGLDIVFGEADKTSLKNYIPPLKNYLPEKIDLSQRELDNDWVLGEAVADTNTVLGYVFILIKEGETYEDVDVLPFPEFSLEIKDDKLANIPFTRAKRPLLNILSICNSALSEGFFNSAPDRSGIVRKVPLLIRYKNRVYPSLPLEMARIGSASDITLCTSSKDGSLMSIRLGKEVIPVNEKGEMFLNFRGPHETFEYISVADILEGTVPPKKLRNKYVLVGTSALGLLDLRATPYSGVFPGVEILATQLDNILKADPMEHIKKTEVSLSITVLLVMGILLIILLTFTRPIIAGIFGFILILSIFFVNYYVFFLNNNILWTGYVLISITLLFLLVLLMNYFLEGREKRFIHSAFSHYVSEDVVAEMTQDPGKLTLDGEEKVITAFFSDIQSFSTFSEKMTAKELSTFLNEYLSAMSDIAMQNKGMIDKFIGDAVVAIYGAPLDNPNHAEDAVRSGLIMLNKLKKMRKIWKARGLPEIFIRIGLNSGMMSVGNMGSKNHFAYTMMGDNVNLAARLESAGKKYGLSFLISEATRKAAGDKFYSRYIDKIIVKGRTQPVNIYEPLLEGIPNPKLKEEVDSFEKALKSYFNMKFDESINIITKLNNKKPHPLYDAYLERLEHFKENPPPENWDGVYKFTTK